MSKIIQMLLKELDAESSITHKMLQRVPNDKLDWQPHQKSMTLKQLAGHVAELPSWITMALTSDGLDFAVTPYQPALVSNTGDLLELHNRSLENGKKSLESTPEDKFDEDWILRDGDNILLKTTKGETVRMSLSQTIHHRAQLGVYFRLLNIPVPATYGPSADEMH
ncbi:DinB family protein [Pararcticibacter amylolyticus]|uniref:Damage-inducible protein DinB n=1 Tax=Pararcticibacter amylolyticus TaxID=2173175 RepID=A0A2U2PKK6_9SPHI|nr:DinB family protein [Pararcticibacter amylolyticus]PWG81802.1 damage-inducible protein DinB [Pararcticibacter amylolyticus]